MVEISYHLLRFFLKLLSHIPFRVLYAMSDGVFYLLYYAVGYRRKIVRQNLTESFPGKETHEIKHIEKSFYHFFADMFFESCKLASMSREEIRHRMAFKNVEEVEQAITADRPERFTILIKGSNSTRLFRLPALL